MDSPWNDIKCVPSEMLSGLGRGWISAMKQGKASVEETNSQTETFCVLSCCWDWQTWISSILLRWRVLGCLPYVFISAVCLKAECFVSVGRCSFEGFEDKRTCILLERVESLSWSTSLWCIKVAEHSSREGGSRMGLETLKYHESVRHQSTTATLLLWGGFLPMWGNLQMEVIWFFPCKSMLFPCFTLWTLEVFARVFATAAELAVN